MIKLQNVSKSFKDKNVLKEVSFIIPDNKITSLIGNNGAGKTTIIKIITNTQDKDDGNIEFTWDTNDIYLFSDLTESVLKISIKDYGEYLCTITKKDFKDVIKKLEKNLELLDCKDLMNKLISKLSAGQRKKVFLALYMSVKPKLLILDEPTANLDIKARVDFLKIIKTMNEMGTSILITSHNLLELQELTDHLIILDEGKIKYEGNMSDTDEKIIKIYKKIVQNNEIDVNVIKENLK